MAQTRIYKFPAGDLDWIGQASVRLVGRPAGLSLILESPERTISAELETEDLKRLLLDLAAAIHRHKEALDFIGDETARPRPAAGGPPS